MKILFLQKVDNARGGIATVNLKLMSYFCANGNEVEVLSIRHGDSWDIIDYPKAVKTHLINERDVWDCPRLGRLVGYIKKIDIISCLKLIIERLKYDRKMQQDYKQCQLLIEEIKPDIIINSHYEVLEGISEAYLKKTIMHFHTSFDQVLENRSYQKFFKKYKDKIKSFVWLSKKTKEEAEKFGLKNSTYIYNPISFKEEDCADMESKKIVFLGRLSEEKRVHLAIEYFKEIIEDDKYVDWTFEIYGDGPLRENILEEINNNSQIIYKGATNNVKKVLLSGSVLILTSEFEGMPLVVLEANECGVPAIIYDFGESSKEVVKNGNTGIIVPQNDRETFINSLKSVMSDLELRKRMSVNAKEFAQNFSVENVGKQWQNLLQDVEKE